MKFLWKISRGSLVLKETFFVVLSDGPATFLGEVSPNTRYGNTPEVIRKDFARFQAACAAENKLPLMTLAEFDAWLDSLNLCNTLRFGVEAAWIHWKAASTGTRIATLLGLPPITEVETSFSVPIMETEKLAEFIRPLHRFKSLKIKVDRATGLDTLLTVSKITQQPLRIDGNEDWTDPDELLRFVEGLKGMNVEFLEQPMPSGMTQAYQGVLPRIPWPLIADESIEDRADFQVLKTQFSGVNIKLMKTGGLLRAIHLLQSARSHGMKTMLGCMVETSVGISAAMHLCSLVDYPDLDGFLLLREDPFNKVSESNGVLTFSE